MSIESLSKFHRTSIEHLSNTNRTSIEHLSNIYRKSMKAVDPTKCVCPTRRPLKEAFGRSKGTCFFILHGPPTETQFSLVNDTFKQAFGRSKGKRFFILHGPPPETQFPLVNDTFKQAFGRSKGKRFFILHAPPSARRNARSHTFGCCLLFVVCCLLSLGKKQRPALPVQMTSDGFSIDLR